MSYSPVLGRFIQRDPLGYVDGRSLYEYARSGPIRIVDPLGTKSSISGREIDSSPSDPASVSSAGSKASRGVWQAIPSWWYAGWGASWDGGGKWWSARGDAQEFSSNFAPFFLERHPEFDCFAPEDLENALRHAYWQALLTIEHGPTKAAEIARIHEDGVPKDGDHIADLHNNDIGRQIGLTSPNPEAAMRMVIDALLNGKLMGRDGDGTYLIDSDRCCD